MILTSFMLIMLVRFYLLLCVFSLTLGLSLYCSVLAFVILQAATELR